MSQETSGTTSRVWVRISVLEGALNPSQKQKKTFGRKQNVQPTFIIPTKKMYDWALAIVVSRSGAPDTIGDVTLRIIDHNCEHNGATVEIPAHISGKDGIVMANKDTLTDDENQRPMDTLPPKDLINLVHLHEPAVVYCLQRRFEVNRIYTATGPILLALNPFSKLQGIYDYAMMKKYFKQGEDGGIDEEALPPHVFGIADNAFRAMMRGLDELGTGTRETVTNASKIDQSILVSGESGAGKTVSTKFIMTYLASVSRLVAQKSQKNNEVKLRKSVSMGADVESKVLESNPILESFGNARTVRNDNSSRFGKFIELQFKKTGFLIGASIETYLLEKVRLVHQGPGERNYHVFYEILSGADKEDLRKLFLTDLKAQDFKMTSMSGTFDRRDEVQDKDTYRHLITAMGVMGFDDSTQNDVFEITAAILHLSNLTFEVLTADSCKVVRDSLHLDAVLSLLGVDEEKFDTAMCSFTIKAEGSFFVRTMSKPKAEKGIEGFWKAAYSALFKFLVQKINEVIAFDPVKHSGTKKAAYIGVLDIFGFESFKTNSFEQLCINYCNEALQHQFNLFIFTTEQKEYEKEGIKWSFIEFPDNKDILELIDKPKAGIIPLLDDQCRAPGTTDKTFAKYLYDRCTGHSRFSADFRQVGAELFGIYHYAGPVEYVTEGFVEKNKDELPKQATHLLLSSSKSFVKMIAAIMHPPEVLTVTSSRGTHRNANKNKKKPTVGGQFIAQLKTLQDRIDFTYPHYVRCLKPNSDLVAGVYDKYMISDQLKCAGVLEAVRVSRVGFSQRYPHGQFVDRYFYLLPSKETKSYAANYAGVKARCQALVSSIIKDAQGKTNKVNEGGIQLGKTKVFLRSDAFKYIEKFRTDKLRVTSIRIQTCIRCLIAKNAYKLSREAVIKIQTVVRMLIAKKVLRELIKQKASITIQTKYRSSTAKHFYVMTKSVVRWSQRMFRGQMGRKRYVLLNKERKATIIQKYWRKRLYLRNFQKQRNAALLIQCRVRMLQARSLLKKKKADARSMIRLKEERNAMSRENTELKKRLKLLEEKLEELEKKESSESEREGSTATTNMLKLNDDEKLNKVASLKMRMAGIRNERGDTVQEKDDLSSQKNSGEDNHLNSEKVTALKERMDGIRKEKHEDIEEHNMPDQKDSVDCGYSSKMAVLKERMVGIRRESSILEKNLLEDKEKIINDRNAEITRLKKLLVDMSEGGSITIIEKQEIEIKRLKQSLKENELIYRELEEAKSLAEEQSESSHNLQEMVQYLAAELDQLLVSIANFGANINNKFGISARARDIDETIHLTEKSRKAYEAVSVTVCGIEQRLKLLEKTGNVADVVGDTANSLVSSIREGEIKAKVGGVVDDAGKGLREFSERHDLADIKTKVGGALENAGRGLKELSEKHDLSFSSSELKTKVVIVLDGAGKGLKQFSEKHEFSLTTSDLKSKLGEAMDGAGKGIKEFSERHDLANRSYEIKNRIGEVLEEINNRHDLAGSTLVIRMKVGGALDDAGKGLRNFNDKHDLTGGTVNFVPNDIKVKVGGVLEGAGKGIREFNDRHELTEKTSYIISTTSDFISNSFFPNQEAGNTSPSPTSMDDTKPTIIITETI